MHFKQTIDSGLKIQTFIVASCNKCGREAYCVNYKSLSKQIGPNKFVFHSVAEGRCRVCHWADNITSGFQILSGEHIIPFEIEMGINKS